MTDAYKSFRWRYENDLPEEEEEKEPDQEPEDYIELKQEKV